MDTPKQSFARRAAAWYRGRSRAQRDLLVILAFALPLYAFIRTVDVVDQHYGRTFHTLFWEFEEVVVLLFCLGLAFMVFAWRRLSDLKSEIAQRQDAEREAHRLARHDVLTGLPNRRRFLEEFAHCHASLTNGRVCALFVLDLDHFKPINDLYGHRLGDEVLRVVAKRLQRIVGDEGTVARLGGDEFGIIMPVSRDKNAQVRLARRIAHEIPKPIALAALVIEVGVSVGVAIDDQDIHTTEDIGARDGSEVETILRQADMAMYRAKTEGRGSYRFFDRDMDDRLQQRVKLESEIKAAISKNEILPYYQPIVELGSGAIIGYEILARWLHPTEGLVPPAVFIPIAEDTGVIGELADNLLMRALADATALPDNLFLSVNLSPRQFADPWLSQKILAALIRANFPPHRLEVEITETAVVMRLDEARTMLQSLRNVGVRVALDDFGTGYSGLHHLRELQLDTIKIDRSFVMNMLESPEDAKLVEAIVALGRVLELDVTAEGIETERVRARLLELGCKTGQGFLFGRPQPIADLLQQPDDCSRQIA